MSGVNNMLIFINVLCSCREGVVSVCAYFRARKMYSFMIYLCLEYNSDWAVPSCC